MADENINENNELKDAPEKGVFIRTMEEVMHDSMIPYSEHVILDRALPRVEDGLKPSQRRILFTMNELGITPDKPHRKSARIVGDCLGKYHPHGDRSVYDAMVRMAQDFNMRMPLIDGHGNFGSIDGDSAAAMRYTEARMAPLALELLRDLDKNTVKWSLNFDDTLKEPDMLPGRFPNLLVNGASGIAVGLATNIPPHNLTEAIDGVIAYIDNPRIKLSEMMRIIKGPDFPTGGYLICGEELKHAYETGRGKVIMRAKIHIEAGDNDKRNIVIDELPYQVNKASFLESVLTLREEKKGIYMGIAEICDESDREGMRAVIRVKKDVDPKPIIEALFKSTNLQCSFGINMVAIADGKPQQMGLLDIIVYYVNYQREIILRRTRFELDEALEREHILEGLVIAVKNIDEVIRIIKKSENSTVAAQRLRERFELSERQAQAILSLTLRHLTHLEIYKLEKELAEIKELIKRLNAILGSKQLQMELIKTELAVIRKAYKEPRRTVILTAADEYNVPSDDDEKPVESWTVIGNTLGAVKKTSARSLMSAGFNEKSSLNEVACVIADAQSNQVLYCFTDLGNCFKLDTDTIPEGKWREGGTLLGKLVTGAAAGEKIIRIYATEGADNLPKGNLLFFTREGMVKKTAWAEYNVVKSSFQAIKLKDGDSVLNIENDLPDTTIMFITKDGMCLNADKSDIPPQGRVAGGVKGIALSDGDCCVMVAQSRKTDAAVLITEKGFGKRVEMKGIDPMARYRKGVKIFDFKGDNGTQVLFAALLSEPATIILHDAEDFLVPFESKNLPGELRTGKGKSLFKGKGASLKAAYIYYMADNSI